MGSAITQNNGTQLVLPGGATHLLNHRNWKFEKFMSEKIQTDKLPNIRATSADNVMMETEATVVWRVTDVQKAAKMSAETMQRDGSDVTNSADADINKLRNDVLQQATASLAAFIGEIRYSDSFHISAAAAAIDNGEKIRAEGARSAAETLSESKVAVNLATIAKTGEALDKKATFFFGADPTQMASVLANPDLVPGPKY